ncbi:MAG: tRNA dihydrouridine synthase DusB [Firmicutes bacterium]|nr:tRNA dihydrouridine synthase DusB [Candidatus Colimorpha enterica]
MSVKIGNAVLKHGLILAPMAGDTDRAMRQICREHGAEYSVTEMVSAKALTFSDASSFALGKLEKDELPASVQLFGHEPDIMERAVHLILEQAERDGNIPTAIDINMGCPVKKIVSCDEGSALMKKPELAEKIFRAAKRASSVPVTVKIRTGWSRDCKNAVEFAKMLEDCGADLIAVHGRTRADMYGPEVDLETIAKVKQAVSVPVIGNGGIFTASDAIRMKNETGCDGLMIARGALGNPWLFENIAAALEGREVPAEPTVTEAAGEAMRELSLTAEYKGERLAVLEGRRRVAYYIHSFEGASAIRSDLNAAKTLDDIRKILNDLILMQN